MKMAATLFTIGYEGLSMDRFTAQLKAAGVRRVVDVRELPLSHKPGFSKRPLSRALEGAGLAYEHIPALGCPRPIRNRYRADNNWPGHMPGRSVPTWQNSRTRCAIWRRAQGRPRLASYVLRRTTIDATGPSSPRRPRAPAIYASFI